MDGCPFRFAFKSGFNLPTKVLVGNQLKLHTQLHNKTS